ncbi:MAG: DUF4175 family protein [Cystobacterineae bacterium]|nr:DUF4175 family protein [Cystobacterineae bacterium]
MTRSQLRAFAWYQLLEATRRRLRLRSLLWGSTLALLLGIFGTLAAGFWANLHAPSAWALLAACTALSVGTFAWSFVRACQTSTPAKAARCLAAHLPSFHLDFLCAWELALPAPPAEHAQHSAALVQAFWENLEKRIQQHGPLSPPRQPLPPKSLLSLGICLGLCCFLGMYFAPAWKTGVGKMQGAPSLSGGGTGGPIAGEFRLRYAFPSYTGLPERVVHNSNGEVNTLQGTTVEWEAKADRKVQQARLVINGTPLPLEVYPNRMLRGRWVASTSGSYQIQFLSQGKTTAQSPPIPLLVERDNPPHVRLLSPESPLVLPPEENHTLLRFEADDDYGLNSLELRYSVDNQTVETLPLPLSQTRFVQADFLWDLGPLALLPGQTVYYTLVAKDNDTEAGNKEGLSQTQMLQKFSQAMHTQTAVDKTRHAWKQLLAHAADLLESGEMSPRASPKTPTAKRALEEQAMSVAAELEQASKNILQDALAPKALATAFENAAQNLRRLANNTTKARQTHNPEFLAKAVFAEVSSAEHHLLYLEDLLGQFHAQAMAEFAKLLKSQLAQLKTLLSQHALATTPEQKAALLAQIQKRKTRIFDLLGRMAEMSQADENADAKEADWSAPFQENTQHAMASLETALAEGHMDEALRQTESMLGQLEDSWNEETPSPQQAKTNAALSEEFENFRQAMESVLVEQEALLHKTQTLQERQRQQAAQELAQKNEAARPELDARLEALRSQLKNLHLERMSLHEQNLRENALKDLEMVKSALSSNDASLASEIVRELVQKTELLAAAGKNQEALDRMLGNSPEERQRSKETKEASLEGAEKARDFQERLRSLFGHKSGVSAEGDTTGFAESVSKQEALGERIREVQRQMEALSEKAPLFDEEAKNNMEKVARHMEKAASRLRLGNAQEGQSEQTQAAQGLQTLKKQLQAGGTTQTSMPLPSASGSLGQGIGQGQKRLVLPKEAHAPPHFRKELLETMRQGVPEGYAEPVRRYYEELVK